MPEAIDSASFILGMAVGAGVYYVIIVVLLWLRGALFDWDKIK